MRGAYKASLGLHEPTLRHKDTPRPNTAYASSDTTLRPPHITYRRHTTDSPSSVLVMVGAEIDHQDVQPPSLFLHLSENIFRQGRTTGGDSVRVVG